MNPATHTVNRDLAVAAGILPAIEPGFQPGGKKTSINPRCGYFQKTARRFSFSPGRIALLAIAQRTVHVSRAHIPLNKKPRKHIPTAIITPGDYILAKRYEKGLHPYEIGKKMGIAGSLVLAWERGESQPDEAQWAVLGRLLAFNAGVDMSKSHR